MDDEKLVTYREVQESERYLVRRSTVPLEWKEYITKSAIKITDYESSSSLSSADIQEVSFSTSLVEQVKEAYANNELVDFNKIFNFSATKFKAGRTNLMKRFLIPFIQANQDHLFQPKLLADIINQKFNFFNQKFNFFDQKHQRRATANKW